MAFNLLSWLARVCKLIVLKAPGEFHIPEHVNYLNFKCFPSDALAEAGKAEGFVFPQGTTARLSAACMGLASHFDASMSLPFDLARGLDKGPAHQYKHHDCMVDLLMTGIPEEKRPASFTYQSGAHKGMSNLDSRGEVVKRLLQQHPQLRGFFGCELTPRNARRATLAGCHASLMPPGLIRTAESMIVAFAQRRCFQYRSTGLWYVLA